MNTRSECFSKIARITLMFSTLLLAFAYSSTSNAAQGCGYGFHRAYHSCVKNHPVSYAHPAYRHRDCWRNARGQVRCK